MKIKKNIKVLLGNALIAIVINLIFVSLNIIPNGLIGLSIFYHNNFDMNLSIVIILANIFFISLGWLFLSKKDLKKCIKSVILLPIFLFLTKDIYKLIDLNNIDILLILIFGSILVCLGYKFIYEEDEYLGAPELNRLIWNNLFKSELINMNYIIDIVLLLIILLSMGFQSFLYSFILITLIELACRRIRIGVGTKKVFYIITKKEREVKDLIIKKYKNDITIIDTKGGFTKNNNKILMTVIPTKLYYKLREEILNLDKRAFISITDSYEVVNENKYFE